MMSTKQYRSLVLFAMLAGFIGGTTATYFLMVAPVFAGKRQQLIEAERIIAKAIKTEEIFLQNGKNNGEISLAIKDDGAPYLALRGKDGKSFVTITISKDGVPTLGLIGKDGKSSATIAISEDGISGLWLKGGMDGKSSASLNIMKGGLSELDLSWGGFKELGPSNVRLTASIGGPSLGFFVENEKDPRISIEVDDKSPSFQLRGPVGSLIASAAHYPKLSLSFNEDKKVIWETP